MRGALKADLALLGVAFVWGATFPVMKLALSDASPAVYLALRFALAALLFGPIVAWRFGLPLPGWRDLIKAWLDRAVLVQVGALRF